MITYIHVYSVTCLTLIHTALKITAVELLLVEPITERCRTVHHAKNANNLNKKNTRWEIHTAFNGFLQSQTTVYIIQKVYWQSFF